MKIAVPRCMPRCRICKRPLKNRESLAKGVGPECAGKFATMLSGAGLTLEALGIPESLSTDQQVARWLHFAAQALLASEMNRVERFKAMAQDAARWAANGCGHANTGCNANDGCNINDGYGVGL